MPLLLTPWSCNEFDIISLLSYCSSKLDIIYPQSNYRTTPLMSKGLGPTALVLFLLSELYQDMIHLYGSLICWDVAFSIEGEVWDITCIFHREGSGWNSTVGVRELTRGRYKSYHTWSDLHSDFAQPSASINPYANHRPLEYHSYNLKWHLAYLWILYH